MCGPAGTEATVGELDPRTRPVSCGRWMVSGEAGRNLMRWDGWLQSSILNPATGIIIGDPGSFVLDAAANRVQRCSGRPGSGHRRRLAWTAGSGAALVGPSALKECWDRPFRALQAKPLSAITPLSAASASQGGEHSRAHTNGCAVHKPES